MTAGLIRKELRSLMPVALLWWIVAVMDPLLALTAGFPDQRPLHPGLSLFDSGDGLGVIGLMVTIWLASGLLVRERDQGTLELLDSLPTSRVHVFAVKFVVGLAILWSGPLLQAVLDVGLHALSTDSLSSGLHVLLMGKVLLLHAAQLFVWLSLAVLLAYLRRLAWVTAALLIFLYAYLDEHVGGVEQLDILSLTHIVFVGADIAIPWNKLAVQLPLAALGTLASGLIFCLGAERVLAWGTRIARTGWGRALAAVVTLSSIALWVFVIDSVSDDPEPEKDRHGVVYPSRVSVHAETDRFRFRYPANLADRARVLIECSSEVDAAVRGFLGAEPLSRVEVDATGAGKSHYYAGRALWKTVQLALSRIPENRIAAVFGHELTHVYIDTLTDRKLADDFNATRFFHEGLAEYVEYRLFRPEPERERCVLVAALAHDRRPLTFAGLIDDRGLVAERDTFLVYPVGRLFFEVLVRAEGDGAPGRILAALAREDVPEDLAGRELWRDGFQAAGLDLEAQVGRFESYLDDLVEGNRDLIDTFPRLGAAVSVETDENDRQWIVLTPRHEGALPWPLTCRIREHATDGLDDYHVLERTSDGTFGIGRDRINAGRIEYQLGLRDPVIGDVVYEPWASATLAR